MANILFKKEISSYYNKNISDLYNDLIMVKKEYFSDNERIVIESFGQTDFYIWKHLRGIINSLDIPIFFIEIYTNDIDIDRFVNDNYKEKIKIIFKDSKRIDNVISDSFKYPETICISPFIAMDVSNGGDYRPCCEFDGKIGNYSAKTHGVDEAWKSKELNDIRQSFLQGKKIKQCSRCFETEKNGGLSKRLQYNNTHQDIFYKTNWQSDNQKLTSATIKLGNACNLTCRICEPKSSSSWVKEIKNNLSAWGLESPPKIELVNWPFETDSKFWKSFKNISSDLTYLSFVGGEPLMNKQHDSILKFLIDQDISKNINLHYNTNGTIWPSEQKFELYQKFKKVNMSLSIDNIYKRFEYERYGSTWELVESNIKKFSSLDKEKYIVDVFVTVSIFNVLDLPKIYNYFQNKKIA